MSRGGHFHRVPPIGRVLTVGDNTPDSRQYRFFISDNVGSVGGRDLGKVGFLLTPPRHYRLWPLRAEPRQPNPVTFAETQGVARTFEASTSAHRRPPINQVKSFDIEASLSSHPSSHPADLNLICPADLNLICPADLNLTP